MGRRFLFIAVLFACACLMRPPLVYAQSSDDCIDGLPCVTDLTPNDPEQDGDGPNADGAPNAKKSTSAACDADFMNQIYARAFLESEREITLASVAIRKPDSVLEYTCFDQLAEKGHEYNSTIFSQNLQFHTRNTYRPEYRNSGGGGGGTGGGGTDPTETPPGPSDTPPPEGPIEKPGEASNERTGLVSIDYDGSPTAYHPHGKGDDYIGNAGVDKAGNPAKSGTYAKWFGIMTKSGKEWGYPYIDPKTGYHVSTTSWGNPAVRDRWNQKRYVNANIIPYVAMTKSDKAKGYKHGDFVLLTNVKTGTQIWTVIGDYAGYRKKPHAELSPAAARLVGISFTKKGVSSKSGHVKQEFFKGTAIPGFFPVGEAGRARILKGPNGEGAPPPEEEEDGDEDNTPDTGDNGDTGTDSGTGGNTGGHSGGSKPFDGEDLGQGGNYYEEWVDSLDDPTSVETHVTPSIIQYLKDNFAHKFLGRSDDADLDYEPGQPNVGGAGSNYSCDMMEKVHLLANCMDFDQDNHQFYDFETLANLDPRTLPDIYKCGKTGITEDLIKVARNEERKYASVDVWNDFGKLAAADECGEPIDTGLIARYRQRVNIIGIGNVLSVEKKFPHQVCVNPICYYDPKGKKCVKK